MVSEAAVPVTSAALLVTDATCTFVGQRVFGPQPTTASTCESLSRHSKVTLTSASFQPCAFRRVSLYSSMLGVTAVDVDLEGLAPPLVPGEVDTPVGAGVPAGGEVMRDLLPPYSIGSLLLMVKYVAAMLERSSPSVALNANGMLLFMSPARWRR